MSLDGDLAARLRQVGVDPADPGKPAAAWQRLHEQFGERATLLDRYALEAAHRGLTPDALDADLRARLSQQVLQAHFPGIEFVAGSDRVIRDPVEITDYDPAWPERFAVWRRRLSDALGPSAVRIDHVGSTAVPGLAAKPIIDIQVSVRDIENEAAYVPSIEAIGVALRLREPAHRYFRPAGDRPRTVHIHVCEAGSRWERDHLLFRDYLRTDPTTRDAYATLKRDLATRYADDRIAYTEAKTAFISDALSQAEEWATRARWQIAPR